MPKKEKKLHLGSGKRKREGWINVDLDPKTEPDLLSSVDDLPDIKDETIDVIDSCHLFEHLTLEQAQTALKEWHRVLKPGAELFIECPNLERCIRILANPFSKADDRRLAMIGVYGFPKAIDRTKDKNGKVVPDVFAMHKWGWSPKTIKLELEKNGFTDIKVLPVTQDQREAARIKRDMRVRAIKV